MDGEQRVAGIVRPLEHGLQLECLHRRLELRRLPVQLGTHPLVRLLASSSAISPALFEPADRDS